MALLAVLSMLLAPFATAGPAGGGDTTVGTLPTSGTAYTRTKAATPILIERVLAGDDGTTLTAARCGILLVARTEGGWIPATADGAGEAWTASWVSSGTTFTITIVQQPNETDDQAADRLDRKVRAMQRLRPRDGPATGSPQGVQAEPRTRPVLEHEGLTRPTMLLVA